VTGGLDELRENGRPFDAIDRLIARVGLEGPLSLAEVAMERHDALLAVVDAAGPYIEAIENQDALSASVRFYTLRAAVNAVKGTTGCQKCVRKTRECVCDLTCNECGRKITDTESCWGACPECADKPGYWMKGQA